jgi:hypothetical protein
VQLREDLDRRTGDRRAVRADEASAHPHATGGRRDVVTVRCRRPVKRAWSLAGLPLAAPRSVGGTTIVLGTEP